ncbi:MAG: hypothetical protein LBS35_11165 [Synergistaceae bacterium]|nr:hypothetical protein [Synergistaceae bacterium]
MRDRSERTGSRVLRVLAFLTAVIVLALCAASDASAALVRNGEISGLMMRVPDEPVTSGDVNLPEAPK